jgi:phage gp36-like protein
MPLLTIADMKTHIYPGASNLITRGDDGILQSALDAAITQAKAYLSRYNYKQLFDNVLADPDWSADTMLVVYVKDIAKWNFIGLANITVDYEDAKNRRDDAIAELGKIQSGKTVPDGWPVNADPVKSSLIKFSSNPKRNNRF